MLADLIRGFCGENEDKYMVFENYSGRMMFGNRCIGIVVKKGYSYFEMMMQLTRYLNAKEFDDPFLELEGVAIDELGLNMIVYFPSIRDYHYPPQP